MSREYPPYPIPAVAALVVRGDDVLLVLRRNPPSAGRWSVPGGVQEVGERVIEALRREVCEETGLDIEAARLVDVGDIVERDAEGAVRYHYVIAYYAARPAGGALHPGDDVRAARWASLDAAAALGVHPRLLALLAAACGCVDHEAAYNGDDAGPVR